MIQAIFLIQESIPFPIVTFIKSPGHGFMMIEQRTVTLQINQPRAGQFHVQSHIIICYGKTLIKSSGTVKLGGLNEQACRGDAQHIISKAVSSIIINTIIGIHDQLM